MVTPLDSAVNIKNLDQFNIHLDKSFAKPLLVCVSKNHNSALRDLMNLYKSFDVMIMDGAKNIKLINIVSKNLAKVMKLPEFQNEASHEKFMRQVIDSCREQYIQYMHQANLLALKEEIDAITFRLQNGGSNNQSCFSKVSEVIAKYQKNEKANALILKKFSKSKPSNSAKILASRKILLAEKKKLLSHDIFKTETYLRSILDKCSDDYFKLLSLMEIKKISMIQRMLAAITQQSTKQTNQ